MKAQDLFERMMNGKQVRITDEFRQYWGICSGAWFYIKYISADGTACLQDRYHSEFNNVPIDQIII